MHVFVYVTGRMNKQSDFVVFLFNIIQSYLLELITNLLPILKLFETRGMKHEDLQFSLSHYVTVNIRQGVIPKIRIFGNTPLSLATALVGVTVCKSS